MARIDIERVGAVIRRVAAEEALSRWRNLAAGDIAEKAGPDDLVTVADRAVEAALARELAALIPGSQVVGEEGVHAEPGLIGLLRRPGPVWVIDPIDGTAAFAAGEPDFAVMVALVEGAETTAGWILAPVTGELTYGARGEGVWRQAANGTAQRIPRPVLPSRLADMIGVVGRRAFSEARRAEVLAKEAHFKRFGKVVCAGIDYPQLADGRSHFALYNKSEPWDHLPGLCLLAEQGFHAARHDGTP